MSQNLVLRGDCAEIMPPPFFFAEIMPKIENPALSLQPILIGRGVGENQKISYKKRCEDYSFKKNQIVRSVGQNGPKYTLGTESGPKSLVSVYKYY
jgi:hypothetical protein